MMTTPLPPPPSPPAVTRTPVHTRAVTYRGFARGDGLWDIEGRMVDTKDYDMVQHEGDTLQAGSPAHDMFIRVTLDDAFKLVDIQTGMAATPFGECLDAAQPMRCLIGATLGQGWRKKIDAALGGERGCTHLRELLFNLATAAFQTITPYRHHLMQQRGEEATGQEAAPHFIGRCMSWGHGSPVVLRHYPKFFSARPAAQPDSQ